MRLCRCFVGLVTLVLGQASAAGGAQSDTMSDAVAAFERGDLASAEQMLRAELKQRPGEEDALGMLAVVLDAEKKYSEADAMYHRALASSRPSPSLLNNYGNHLVAMGRLQDARPIFLKVLTANPAHVNACTQLARIDVVFKRAAEAEACLDRLPAPAQESPAIKLLRMQVQYAAGRNEQADQMTHKIAGSADADPQLNFALGVALAAVGQNEKAETFFARSVEIAPENFEALYDLGLAASHAGHKERARQVLEKALEKQPQNVDVLYDLAAVNAELGRNERSLELIARAAHLAPDRADVQRLLAHMSFDFGDFSDAIEAWKRYMALAPGDDVGRREHGFAETALGDNAQEGLKDLEWYVRRHPTDATGHFELGTAEAANNPDGALKELDRALALKPDLTAAHTERGLLNLRLGNAAAALPDFEFSAGHQPQNARILDRLGQTYAALNRPADALRTFRKAAELAPNDSAVLLHLGRALENADQKQEAKTVFARFREAGPNRAGLPQAAGLVDFLSLSPEEQFARYRAGVERTVQNNPGNAEAEVRYLALLLGDGKNAEAETVAHRILELKPSATVLEEAASALLESEHYSLADKFLREAIANAAPSRDLRFDTALATFHVTGAQQGLQQLNSIPTAERSGDYDLARMQMLESLGRKDEADSELKQALSATPRHPELYRQVALVLIKQRRTGEAQQLLVLAARVLPDNRDLSWLAVMLAGNGPWSPETDRLLREFASRWPESARLWAEVP
jgi:tetratricopeptide (TPR) repeat protein